MRAIEKMRDESLRLWANSLRLPKCLLNREPDDGKFLFWIVFRIS
jgi:hypothetical protein